MAENVSSKPVQSASYTDVPVIAPVDAAERTAEVASLLQSLDEAAAQIGRSASPVPTERQETELVHARLGIASGLHAALRCKHPGTASHCLRVALGCSSWAAVAELDPAVRDALEVAALLHDVGKIGVPDKVLLKPGRLSPEETDSMSRHAAMTVEILTHCGAPRDVIEIVRYSGARFDGQAPNQQVAGDSIPLAARILAIVDAFDSMTTDHVYRPARSRERAIAELYRCAGTQFDAQLVRKFSELFAQDQNLLTQKLARHWLRSLSHHAGEMPWEAARRTTTIPAANAELALPLFEKMLLENMHDGVLFVDADCRIVLWNTGLERLTGVSSQAARGRMFLPSLLDMFSPQHARIADDDCPVARAIQTGVQTMGRINIMGRQGRPVAVDMHTIPVRRSDGVMQGATVLLHDASSETTLEERCQALALAGLEGPAHASCQPGRVRPHAGEFHRRPPGIEAALQPDHVRYRSF